MKKTMALLMCVALALALCACGGSKVAGTYRLDMEATKTALFNKGILDERDLEAASLSMAGELGKFVDFEFDKKNNVYAVADISDINSLMPLIASASALPADFGISWAERDGKLVLSANLGGAPQDIELDYTLDGKTLRVSYEGVTLSFTRASGLEGLAGGWELDLEQLKQTLVSMGRSEEAGYADYVEELSAQVKLNEDGTVGLYVKAKLGTYKGGTITLSGKIGELSKAGNVVYKYKLDGKQLTLTVQIKNGEETMEEPIIFNKIK